MLKKGFTLAEVLITLTIIGVVATLTTPALVKNVGSSKIGPQLSKFVNTFESAIETMMTEEGVGSLKSIFPVNANQDFMDKLSEYIIMTKYDDTLTLKNPQGGPISIKETENNYKKYMLKDGTIIIYALRTRFPGTTYEPTGAYQGFYNSLYVDIGGIKGSHRTGKEVFLFYLDSSGVLIPYASNAHKAMVTQGMGGINCDVNTKDGFIYALACTGAIADNGYKAPW